MSASDLEARREAARAKLAAAQARLAESKAASDAAAEVEALERAASDAEALANAVAKYGPEGTHVSSIPTILGAIIVHRPTGAAFRKFQDQAKMTSEAFEQFVRPCIAAPDASTVDKIFDQLPATLARVADAVVMLAGARRDEQAGK